MIPKNHVHRGLTQPLRQPKGLNISTTVELTKTRAFGYKSCQNISSTVGFTKIRAFARKFCQNCSILLYYVL